MRLDINSLQVESFPTGAAFIRRASVISDELECATQDWGCEGSSVPSCEINMCEPEDVPDTYFEPCSEQMTCPRRCV